MHLTMQEAKTDDTQTFTETLGLERIMIFFIFSDNSSKTGSFWSLTGSNGTYSII